MLQKNAPKAHLNMIRRVERIDKEAAIYLKKKLKEYDGKAKGFSPNNYLLGCIVFSETPQGFTYWSNIMKQLGEW